MSTKEAIHVAINAIDDADELRKQLTTALASKEEAEREREAAIQNYAQTQALAIAGAESAEAQLATLTAERDKLAAGSMAAGDYQRLVDWIRDPNRKPPALAFTAGGARVVADIVDASGVLSRHKLAGELAKAGSKYRAKVGEYVNRLKYTNGGPPLPGPDLILSGDEFGTALARWQELAKGGGE